MLLKKVKGDPQTRFFVSICEYCGSPFIKLQNATKYCSKKCRGYSDLEHTEKRVRKHRRKHKNKSDNYWGLGSGYLHGKPKSDFKAEHDAILWERRRLRLPAK